MTNLEQAHEIARDHLHTNATRMKDWYDRKIKPQHFTEGQKVKILNLRLYPGKTNKWMLRFTDEGIIKQKINDVTFRIFCDKWRPNEKIVHVDKLRPIVSFHPREDAPEDPDIDQSPIEEQQD